MRRAIALLGVWFVASAMGVPQVAWAAKKQVCIVCSVKKGSTTPEEVEAVRDFEGTRYDFCSGKCAKEFDAEPAAYVPPLFPRPAPDLALIDLEGKPLTWKTLEGRVVLLDFWATWCTPCRKSMPELQALHDKYAERGFTVVGVSIDEGGPSVVKKFVAARKVTYPIALDPESSPMWERFRVKAVPAAFLVDPKGQIVAQWLGRPASVREVEQKIEDLLPRTD
jgi:peroxiredoxin/YHS domain-containing protein